MFMWHLSCYMLITRMASPRSCCHTKLCCQVLDLSDSYIPEGEEPPRLGAVPVRFFGTYAFSWIESKRAIEPFDDERMEHASSSRQPEFQRGVTEAKHFQVGICYCIVHA